MVKKKEQLNLLNRSGQYDLEDSSNLAVCEDHKNMLGGFRFTHKYVNNPKCLWSNHYGDFVPANKGEKRKKNQKKIRFRNKCISAEECKLLREATNYLIPCDSLICLRVLKFKIA